ncbi:MAG: fused MFS/spermidine synthase [Deltaproteobacteria bacterium]|nr:fused MFS/spermidine synthase [Deltaproteobacteria bacterium]
MDNRAIKVAPLLLLSGMCALIYQNTWQRDFRLIFGASTAASAAVIAVFIGGLGIGGLILGKRAEKHPEPLLLYANLETGVAVSAALTPALLWLSRKVYIGLGGTTVLGLAGGTVLRLVLSAFVLAIPTLLMGGTLPAAARAVETERDHGRRGVAILYGFNALGAVTGCLLAAFVMLELFGTRVTLWMACLVNLVVALVARIVAGSLPSERSAPAPTATVENAAAPGEFVLVASGVVGFAFFLMELVWYRMLGPILGGTVFTFGLILAVALLGIGLGSGLYALRGQQRTPTILGFAMTCLLEGAFIALPYALGDRIAVLAIHLRAIGAFGFWGYVAGWGVIALIVILPAALVSGYQFPMLIALLGRGRESVGRHVAWAYASNTVGAIAGSLAGGFGLLPWLTATGCWRMVTIVMVALGVAAIALSAHRERRWVRLTAPLLLAVVSILMLRAGGPSAAWRQSPIGAGRVGAESVSNPNAIRRWIESRKHFTVWQQDGVESAVGVSNEQSFAFLVNGKVDGNARADAPTQVMGGLLGTALHPHPKSAIVIGLGTGSTAGWLGKVPELERVDVVEFEPTILRVARDCAPVNQDVLSNPKVHIILGDAREVLQTTRTQYDVVLSEPSNPYRSGIASLFTEEYYRSALARLNPDGLFLQWVQGYEVDGQTIRTIYATFASVFPVVETWQLRRADMVLVGSMKPLQYDAAALRARISQEPYRTALAMSWRTTTLEGFLGHYVARPSVGAAIAAAGGGQLNTDDQILIEFGFARSLNSRVRFDTQDIIDIARPVKQDLPEVRGEVDWQRVEQERELIPVVDGESPRTSPPMDQDTTQRILAFQNYVKGEFAAALSNFRQQPRSPVGPMELAMLGETLADAEDATAEIYADQLRATHPAEADTVMARLRYVQNRPEDACRLLESALTALQHDPWPWLAVMYRALKLVETLSDRDAARAARFFDLLKKPFAAQALNEYREDTLVHLSRQLDIKARCRELFELLGPHVTWEEPTLAYRFSCYKATGHPKADQAEADLLEYLSKEPVAFSRMVEVR